MKRNNDRQRVTETVREYREIREDYVCDGTIFDNDEEMVSRLKWVIQYRLNQVDRTIIILYADCASYAKLGKRLGISHTTAREEVLRIRNRIQDIFYENTNDYELITAHMHSDLHRGGERIHAELAVSARQGVENAGNVTAPSATL